MEPLGLKINAYLGIASKFQELSMEIHGLNLSFSRVLYAIKKYIYNIKQLNTIFGVILFITPKIALTNSVGLRNILNFFGGF